MIGFETLDAAVHHVARGAEVLHAIDPMRRIPFHSGGPPLQSVAVYRSAEEPDHWHFVSFGLSAMGDDAEDEDESFPFELTMRVAVGPDEDAPPSWPVLLLRGLARYVRETGRAIQPGDTFGNGAPITHASGQNPYDDVTGLTEFLFGLDSGLHPVSGPGGDVTFVQAFGLYAEEFLAAQRWSGASMWALLQARDELMVTDPWRESWMQDESFAREVEEGIAEEGSSVVSTLIPGFSWEPHPDGDSVTLNVAPQFLGELVRMLEGRSVHGREFFATSERDIVSEMVRFEIDSDAGWHVDEQHGYLVVRVEPDSIEALIETLSESSEGYVEVVGGAVRIWIPAADDGPESQQ